MRGTVGDGKNCCEEKHEVEIQIGAEGAKHEVKVLSEDDKAEGEEAGVEERRCGEGRGVDSERGGECDAGEEEALTR